MAIMHERIKELRNKHDLTLSQVAEYIGVTEATAQRYETGKGIKTIPYDVIEKYANLFKCEPQYIMGWEAKIEEKPVEAANKLADLFLRLEFNDNDNELMTMLEEYWSLDNSKKAQVREYVHFLFISGKN